VTKSIAPEEASYEISEELGKRAYHGDTAGARIVSLDAEVDSLHRRYPALAAEARSS
jgi:hypothetical protein